MRLLSRTSPNCAARRGAARPDLVVLHHTGMTSCDAALERLCDPASEVSAHYLMGEDGAIWALVPETERAWHAGQGRWGGVTDVNSRSIGVELANPGPLAGHPPFPERQMQALEALLAEVLARWAIPAARVIGHSDMAPARKCDPGPRFDWRRLARAGLSVWPEAAPVSGAAGFAEAAARFGYDPGAAPEAVLDAFRLRFRPQARGRPLEDADLAAIGWLAAHHPCIDAAPLPT